MVKLFWKSFLSCLLTVVPHSPEQTQTIQLVSILQKDSFNQWSCVFNLIDKLIDQLDAFFWDLIASTSRITTCTIVLYDNVTCAVDNVHYHRHAWC